MSTELETPEVPETPEQTPSAPEPTAIEKRAMEMGWRPRTEFQGSDDDFIDAKEFVRRQPLFDKIESQSKELKQVRRAIDALKAHYTNTQEIAVRNAINKLKEARQEAITNSDGASFEQLDAQIKHFENEATRVKLLDQQETVPEVHPEFEAWTSRNRWYQNDIDMRDWADAYGKRIASDIKDPDIVLKKVEEQVRKVFPHKFTNPNKSNAPNVESGKATSGKGSDVDDFQLTPQEKKIMNDLVRTKQMTKEKYIEQLKQAYAQSKR